MIPIKFYGCYDVVVIGTNSENADYDNPRGEIYGFAGYIYAVDNRGARRALHIATSNSETEIEDKVTRLANALTARLANGKLPVGFANWDEYRPEYGSIAYIEEGGEDELIEWERSLEEQ
jgi:hypothetical protein